MPTMKKAIKRTLIALLVLSLYACGGGGETGSSDLGPVVSSGDVFSDNSGVITFPNVCEIGNKRVLNLSVNDIRNDTNRESIEADHILEYGELAVPYYI